MRKKTRRKVWALVNPIQHAIEGAAITPEDKLNQLQLRELTNRIKAKAPEVVVL